MSSCPCGSGRDFAQCCEPILDGSPAPSAEALMRSRYSAFATGRVQHLHDTLAPEARSDYDPAGTESWARQAQWQGLKVVSTDKGGPDDEEGTVEFIARFRLKGADNAHHEKARFRRVDGQWAYVDGEMPKPEQRVVGPKVGRNDPCPCGSGKKFKKCCAAAA